MIWQQSYPFINLSLRRRGETGDRHLFDIAHQRDPKRPEVRCVEAPPAYLRRLSHLRDGRAEEMSRWTPVPELRRNSDVPDQVPWLVAELPGDHPRRFPAGEP